jgi:hypothetical protein
MNVPGPSETSGPAQSTAARDRLFAADVSALVDDGTGVRSFGNAYPWQSSAAAAGLAGQAQAVEQDQVFAELGQDGSADLGWHGVFRGVRPLL